MASGNLRLPHCGELLNRYTELQSRLALLQGLVGPTLANSLFPEGTIWSKPIRSITGALSGEEFDSKALLDWLRSGITQPEMPTNVDYVRIMSLHKSKGLTADMVVVVGCIEGALPSNNEGDTPAEQQRLLEEQRRLFYVAVTRPKQILVLSSITQLPRKLAHRIGIPLISGPSANGHTIASRFLRELGPSRPQAIRGTTLLSGARSN